VALRKGAGSNHRGDDGGARGDVAIENRTFSTLPELSNQYAITDGRDAVGTVVLRGDYYVAVDPDGRVIGRFRDLKIAVRALPGRAS
jgi:hypothetical protein